MLVTHEMRFAREVADTSISPTAASSSSPGRRRNCFDHPVKERTRAFLSQIL